MREFPRTKGELEAAISQAVVRFEREIMGRGPLEARTHLVEDIVLVRLKDVLTVAEQHLAERVEQGAQLVKQMRQQLKGSKRPLLDELMQGLLGVKVRAVYTDINTSTGEGLLVLTLENQPLAPETPLQGPR